MARTLRNQFTAFWAERENLWGEPNNHNHAFVNHRLISQVLYRSRLRPPAHNEESPYSFIGHTGDAENKIIRVSRTVEGPLINPTTNEPVPGSDGKLFEFDGFWYCFDEGKWRGLSEAPVDPFPGWRIFVQADSQHVAFDGSAWRRVTTVRSERPAVHLTLSHCGPLRPSMLLGKYLVTIPFRFPAGLRGSKAFFEPYGFPVSLRKNGETVATINYATEPVRFAITALDEVRFSAGDEVSFVSGPTFVTRTSFTCNLVGVRE